MGHRDTGTTDCPGHYLYADLAGIRVNAHSDIYAPQFTTTSITGAPVHAPHRLTIRLGLTRRAHWTLTLIGRGGHRLMRAYGTGRAAVLSWTGLRWVGRTRAQTPVLPQRVTWLATASRGHDHAKPRSGYFYVGPPLL
jgi:hypothetical protein